MNARGKLLWTEKIAVRWGDMDEIGHVNNTYYLRYMEQARVAWLRALGVPMMANNCGPVIVRAVCDYLKAVTYPSALTVALYGSHIGNRSFTLGNEIRLDGPPHTLFSTGEAVIVFIDHGRLASIPIPDAVRTVLV